MDPNTLQRPLSSSDHKSCTWRTLFMLEKRFVGLSIKTELVFLYFRWHKNSGLSNHPGKLESIFFCYAAMCFPHIGECLNLQKGRLRDKMYLNSILEKGAFCLKRF